MNHVCGCPDVQYFSTFENNVIVMTCIFCGHRFTPSDRMMERIIKEALKQIEATKRE